MSNETSAQRLDRLADLTRFLDEWKGPKTSAYWRLESERAHLLNTTKAPVEAPNE